jgi:hypothetical protein
LLPQSTQVACVGLAVVTNSLADTINRDHLQGVNMTYAARPPNKKPIRFPVPQDDVAARLLSWIRGTVQSNYELVGALERLRHSYRALLAGTSVPDSEAILWQVEVALKDAERTKNALALDPLRRPDRA